MKNYLTILPFFILSIFAYGQTLNFDFGGNYGTFHDFRKEGGSFSKEYSPGYGYSFDLRISEVKIDSFFNLQFALGFEQYEGSFIVQDGGISYGALEIGSLKKQIIDFEFYPVNIRFLKHCLFSTGIEVNFKVQEYLKGTSDAWSMIEPNQQTIDLSTINGFVRPVNWGINTSLGYEFTIGKYFIKPFYKYYLGVLVPEFNSIQSNAKSHRHYFQIGIGYKIK